MFTYQHRTKQSLDHISPCFSLSRDHNKLCLGQCSRLSEFGVAKVRPRAGLLSTQDRSGPSQLHPSRVCTAPAACTQWPVEGNAPSAAVSDTQIFLSMNTEKALPNQNSFWESPSSEDWANWKEHIFYFDVNTIFSLCQAIFPFRMADAGWLKELLNKVKMPSKLH